MEQLRKPPLRPVTAPPAPAPVGGTATDLAGVAQEATARAAAVPLAAATVTVTVKTTSAQAAELLATPDTTVGEVMARACEDLGVRDPGRYVLVAQGEVIADAGRTLRELLGDGLGTGLTARLVKRPEAGERAPWPS
jgi:hypothetical protein